MNTFIKLCCGGVSPPLDSVYVGVVHDVFLISTTTWRILQVGGKGFLFYAFCYNIVTIVAAVLFSMPISRTTGKQENLEGRFRFAQMRLKSSAERVALLHGEELERSVLDERLFKVIDNTRTLILQYFRLEFVTALRGVGGDFFGLATAVVLACSRMVGVLDIQTLATGMGYFRLFSTACQGLPEKLPVLSTMAGLSKRLVEAYEALERGHAETQSTSIGSDSLIVYSWLRLSCSNLSYSTPPTISSPRRQLVHALHLCLEEGLGIVIRGAYGHFHCRGQTSYFIAQTFYAFGGATSNGVWPICDRRIGMRQILAASLYHGLMGRRFWLHHPAAASGPRWRVRAATAIIYVPRLPPAAGSVPRD